MAEVEKQPTLQELNAVTRQVNERLAKEAKGETPVVKKPAPKKKVGLVK